MMPNVALVANASTWVEGAAVQQMETTAQLPGMVRVVGMPDVHPGRGYPVGASFLSQGIVYPALIGNDIGCGMAWWATEMTLGKSSLEKWDKRLGNLDGPCTNDEREALCDRVTFDGPWSNALGTIGGGNHFAELQKVDEVMDEAAWNGLGVDRKAVFLLVHSGSRGWGQSILNEHTRAHGHHGLSESKALEDYLSEHDAAMAWAVANRRCIAHRILERLNTTGT